MAFRNIISCYVCDRRFVPRSMKRIGGKENAHKGEIAIHRREENDMPPLEVNANTKICINCNQSILNEIHIIELDPTCLTINVLTQTRSSSCLICNAVRNLHRLSIECKAYVFLKRNIYIPEGVKSCAHHLDNKGHILYHLLNGLRFINRPYVIRGPLLDLLMKMTFQMRNLKLFSPLQSLSLKS